MAFRVIGRTRWNATARIHRPELRSTPRYYHYESERIQTEWKPAHQYGLNASQQRYRSDLLKYRAVEALKKKNSAPGASIKNTAIDKKEENATSTEKDAIETTAADNRQPDFYGDDNDGDIQLAGSTAAATSTSSPSSSSVGSAAKIESTYEYAPASSFSSQITNLKTNSADSNNDMEIREVTKNNTDSNPWAHMQLHEFAPKIVVVGVGGAVS